MSSRNRLCHGLRSRSAHHLLEPRLSRILAAFEEEHRPRGDAQRACVMAMAICAARTYQIDALMEEALRDADLKKAAARAFTLANYAATAMGGFCNALNRLEKLKSGSNVASSVQASARRQACRRNRRHAVSVPRMAGQNRVRHGHSPRSELWR